MTGTRLRCYIYGLAASKSMIRKLEVSRKLQKRAEQMIPGGVNSLVRAFRSVGMDPPFIVRGQGSRIWDADGNDYVDYVGSWGPLILGHAAPGITEAIGAAAKNGTSFGASIPSEADLAELVISAFPHLEKVRFVSSGTEATMSAIRLARAYTQRKYIVKFEGCYHGHADAMLVQAGSGLATGRIAASSAGVPDGILADTLVVPLDDASALDRVFDEHGATMAAVILEPLPANYGLLPQRSEWLHGVINHCRTAGSLVIFDEVISGFRVGRGGMAEEFGVRPDLVTYGKVIGGGFPVAAYAGRADLMDHVAPAGPVYQAGTLSANPVGMRAGLATVGKMDRLDGWRALNDRAAQFCSRLSTAFTDVRAPIDIVSHASIFWPRVASSQPVRRVDQIHEHQRAWYAKFFHAALRRGVYLPPAAFEVCFLSMAHDDDILRSAVDLLADAAEEAGTP